MWDCPFNVIKVAVAVGVEGVEFHWLVVVVFPFNVDFAFFSDFENARNFCGGQNICEFNLALQTSLVGGFVWRRRRRRSRRVIRLDRGGGGNVRRGSFG